MQSMHARFTYVEFSTAAQNSILGFEKTWKMSRNMKTGIHLPCARDWIGSCSHFLRVFRRFPRMNPRIEFQAKTEDTTNGFYNSSILLFNSLHSISLRRTLGALH